MNHPRPRARLVVSATMVVAALVGYLVFVSTTRADTSRLGALVVTQPAIKGLKAMPGARRGVPASSMPFTAATKAAAQHPDATGAFAAAWAAPTKKGAKGSAATPSTSANLLVELLPDRATATKVRQDAIQRYSNHKALASSQLAISSRYTVAGVPGAGGLTFTSTSPGVSSSEAGYAVTYQFHRAVVVGFVQTTAGTAGQADVSSLARAEYHLLQRTEPGFSLAVTTRPAMTSLIYWVVALVVASLPLVVPWSIRRRRGRRAAKRAARARFEVRSRGYKAVRRHRTPAWARTQR